VDRVVATYRLGVHDVVVVETCEDDGSWYHLIVDGLVLDEMLPSPPTATEIERIVPQRAHR
jgi:hypothetical protein